MTMHGCLVGKPLRPLTGLIACVILFASVLEAVGQSAQPGYGVPVQSNVSSGGVGIPQTNLSPINSAPPTGPQGFPPPSMGSNFDPYAMNPNSQLQSMPAPSNPGVVAAPGMTSMGAPTPMAPYTAPPPNGAISPAPPGSSLFSRMFNPASSQTYPPVGAPPGGMYNNPSVYGAPGTVYGAPTGAAPGYPGTIYPSQSPSSLFPSGYFGEGMSNSDFINSVPGLRSFKLIQGPRLRHTYVAGGDGANDLSTNDSDISIAFAFPNFLYSTQPLYVIPSFSLHLWDGPTSTTGGLPPNAYSAFLDVGWFSDPNQIVSTELGVRVGAFTDFDTFEDESIRVLGQALVSFRWTPVTTLKAGVIYLDRNDIKLVPAGGIICQSTPFKRYEFYFPQPKFSHYCRTVGTKDVWWYVSGDFGGGSWTIKRADGAKDSVDINEARLLLGMEFGDSNFIRNGRRTGFFEIGWAFEREIEYRYNPEDNIDPGDGLIVRAGLGY